MIRLIYVAYSMGHLDFLKKQVKMGLLFTLPVKDWLEKIAHAKYQDADALEPLSRTQVEARDPG